MIKPLQTLGIFLLCAVCTFAQDEIRVESAAGPLGWLINPYRPRSVPPIRVTNSPRLDSLIRAGNLYLAEQDVVALAIENNIDVEVQRYGPLLAREDEQHHREALAHRVVNGEATITVHPRGALETARATELLQIDRRGFLQG